MLKCHYVRKKNVVIIQIIYLKGSNLCSLAICVQIPGIVYQLESWLAIYEGSTKQQWPKQGYRRYFYHVRVREPGHSELLAVTTELSSAQCAYHVSRMGLPWSQVAVRAAAPVSVFQKVG